MNTLEEICALVATHTQRGLPITSKNGSMLIVNKLNEEDAADPEKPWYAALCVVIEYDATPDGAAAKLAAFLKESLRARLQEAGTSEQEQG